MNLVGVAPLQGMHPPSLQLWGGEGVGGLEITEIFICVCVCVCVCMCVCVCVWRGGM